MAVPVVVSASPADADVNIALTASIAVTFNTDIDEDSVKPGTFVVYRTDTLEIIDGTYSTSGAVVTFRPGQALFENKSYTFGLQGSDSGTPAGSIESTTSDELATTTRYTFTTEVQPYATLDEVLERADVTHDGPVRLADITEPGGLKLTGMSPRGFSTNQDVDLDTVTFTFSAAIDADTVTAESFTLETYPALGSDRYYARPDPTEVGGEPHLQVAAPTGMDWTQPTGTFAVTGTQIIWTRGAGEPDFASNSDLVFHATQDVLDVNGQSLVGDVDMVITTAYFPKFIDARVLRLECGPMLAGQNDDTINRMIHKNSIEAWEQSGYTIDITDPYPAVFRWVRHKSVIDLYDMLNSYAQLMAGQSKILDNLDIKYPASVKLNHGLRTVAEMELKKLQREIRWYRGQLGVQVTSLGRDLRSPTSYSRTWAIDYNSNSIFYGYVGTLIPASNLDAQRIRKLELTPTMGVRYYYGTTPSGAGLFASPRAE